MPDTVLKVLMHGPFAGVVGFSSGAAMAAIITSILEKRQTLYDPTWKAQHPSFKFSVCLSGFTLGPLYQQIYTPSIVTPALLAIGSDDPVVLPAQTRSLANRFQDARLFEFTGIHYIPQFKEFPRFHASLVYFLEGILDAPTVKQ